MAKRILALIAAVAMVAGALAYRSSRQPAGSGGSDASRSANGAIVCAEELGPVCDAIDGATVEPATETADRLIAARSAEQAGIGGWLAPGPWPAMVDDERERTSKRKLFAAKGEGLASAPIVAVFRKGPLPADCAASVTWRCLGDAAQETGFRIGGEAPATSNGLFLRAAALAGFFEKVGFATNDLDEPGAEVWYGNLNARLAAAPGFGAPSLDDFLAKPATVQVFVTGGGAANRIGGNVSFEVRTPSPVVTIAVAYTPSVRNAREVDTGAVSQALRDAGWKVQPNAKSEGLPSPGVLLALRSS